MIAEPVRTITSTTVFCKNCEMVVLSYEKKEKYHVIFSKYASFCFLVVVSAPLSKDPLTNKYSPHFLRALEYIYGTEGIISSGGVDRERFMIDGANRLLQRSATPLKGRVTFQTLTEPLSLKEFADNAFDTVLC